MTLSFTIENYKNLPDGGPTSVTVSGRRGIDIGRDSSLDWTLPDPNCAISGKHCEIRYEDGGFVLHDVSLNGTFLNGAPGRMQAPHRLRNGDRMVIGEYIIAVKLDLADDAAANLPGIGAAARASPHAEDVMIWLRSPQISIEVGLAKSGYRVFVIGGGAFVCGVIATATNGSLATVLFAAVIGGLLIENAIIIGFLLGGDSQSDKRVQESYKCAGEKSRTAARTNNFGVRDVPHIGYPRWLVTLFPVSLVAFMIGLLSALYIVLVSFSTIALAGTYLIPFGLTALYYLLGAAERRAY